MRTIITNTEREVLRLIEQKPSITQDEIAELLSVKRSSVATHVSNLTKKGYILGRGYILSQQQPVVVFGGATISFYGHPFQALSQGESVPGNMKNDFGGVGALTAIELAKLSIASKFITSVGDDVHGKEIIRFMSQYDIGVNDVFVNPKLATSTYLGIFNGSGVLEYAVADMEIFDSLEETFFFEQLETIKNANVCFIDANFPETGLEILMGKPCDTQLVINTINTSKAHRFINCLDKCDGIITSLNELAVLAIEGTPREKLQQLHEKGLSFGIVTDYSEQQRKVYLMNQTGEVFEVENLKEISREQLTAYYIQAQILGESQAALIEKMKKVVEGS